MTTFRFGLPLAMTVLLTLGAAPAMAQAVNFPTQANPGLQPTSPTQLPPSSTQPVEDPTGTEVKLDIPQSDANVQIQASQFKVNSLTLEGNTLLRPVDYESLLKSYEGKETSLDELSKLVDKINDLYRAKGYLTSQAYIPPQDIESGNLKIQVVEGKIGNLTVSGNRFYKAWAITRNVDQDPGEPLNIRKLESALNRINQQENFRLRATLSPGDETGETDVRLDVAERQPWQVTGTVDNQGRPFIGTMRWGGEVQNENVLGLGDRFFAKYIGARGTNVALASYFIPINRFGDEIGANFGYSYVNVDLDGLDVPQPRITGHAFNWGAIYTHPFDRNRHLVGDFGLNIKRVSTYINKERADRDDVRSLQWGLTYNRYDRWGRSFARGAFTWGPDWLGANQQFSKWELSATRLQRLPKNNLLILRAFAQLSPDALPPIEQFQLGGAYSVRGFTEGLLIGDRGFNFGVEWRWPIPGLRYACPWMADRVQGALFYDIGGTYLDRSSTSYVGGISSSAQRTFLTGGGVGLRFRLTRFASGFVGWGFGMVNRDGVEPNAFPTARLHFGVRSDFLADTIQPQTAKKSDEPKAEPAPEAVELEKPSRVKPAAPSKAAQPAEPLSPTATMSPALVSFVP